MNKHAYKNAPIEKRFSKDNQPDRSRVGRKKGQISLTTILKKFMDRELNYKDPIDKKLIKGRIGDVIILELISKALKGDIRAIQEILDRTDGKPIQQIENHGTGNINLQQIFAEYNTDGLKQLVSVIRSASSQARSNLAIGESTPEDQD